MKQNFTLDDIEYFLEEMGFKWLDRQVYDYKSKKYERAALKHFKKPFACIFLQNGNGRMCTVVAYINNNEFILKFGDSQVDMTNDWVEVLNNKIIVKENYEC